MKYLIIAVALLLGACSDEPYKPNPNEVVTDQCLRIKLAQQCMKDLPKGPNIVGTSNDWDEVVDQCDTNAKYQARRRRQYVAPECAL